MLGGRRLFRASARGEEVFLLEPIHSWPLGDRHVQLQPGTPSDDLLFSLIQLATTTLGLVWIISSEPRSISECLRMSP